MSAELLFYAMVIAGVLLMAIGLTIILRHFGIGDDWDPSR